MLENAIFFRCTTSGKVSQWVDSAFPWVFGQAPEIRPCPRPPRCCHLAAQRASKSSSSPEPEGIGTKEVTTLGGSRWGKRLSRWDSVSFKDSAGRRSHHALGQDKLAPPAALMWLRPPPPCDPPIIYPQTLAYTANFRDWIYHLLGCTFSCKAERSKSGAGHKVN